MNRKLPKSREMRPEDYVVDDRMDGEVAQALAELRRLGVTPAPFNLAMPWSQQVKSGRMNEFLLRPKIARQP